MEEPSGFQVTNGCIYDRESSTSIDKGIEVDFVVGPFQRVIFVFERSICCSECKGTGMCAYGIHALQDLGKVFCDIGIELTPNEFTD